MTLSEIIAIVERRILIREKYKILMKYIDKWKEQK